MAPRKKVAPKTRKRERPAKPAAAPVDAAPVQDDGALAGASVVGRPTKLSPLVVQAVTDALARGLTIEQACVCADISTTTYQRWMATAETGDERFVAFRDAVMRARTRGIEARLRNIVMAAEEGVQSFETVEVTEQKLNKSDEVVTLKKKTKTTRTIPPDWKAAAWWLERVEPKQFAPVNKNEISGPGGGPIPYKRAEDLSDDELARIATGAADAGPHAADEPAGGD
jgi:hypothetical protein